jgi:ABC-type multidrug transport system ATPase subunit
MTELVRFESVVKHYGHRAQLSYGDLSFRSGERILITGANGSGKSTLLRLLAGVSIHTGGRISRSEEWRRLRLAYVPQAGGLYDDLSVQANFEVRRLLYGTAPALDAVIDGLKLADWLGARTGDLSGGYRRLVAVAAALTTRPDVLIMDEPLDGLDAMKSDALRAALSDVTPRLRLMVTAAPASTDLDIPGLNGRIHIENGRATWALQPQSS